MVEKAKIFYFTVFIMVVIALVFHLTAMGHHHWKKAEAQNITSADKYGFNYTSIGLFTRCATRDGYSGEHCFPNKFPGNISCDPFSDCRLENPISACDCDYLPSTKGIAACTIIAAISLGIALIILFVHSINTSETRSMSMILSLFPLIFLLLAFASILTALILVGSYLSRDMMSLLQTPADKSKYFVRSYKNIEK
jgi:hypothetical protein